MSTFTLDAGGAGAAGQGIGSLFKAFALGPQMRQQAEMETMGSMAKINQAQAAARYANSKAALDENQLSLQAPGALLSSAMGQQGMDQSALPDVAHRLLKGAWGGQYAQTPPVDGIGPVQPPPVNNDGLANIARAIALMQRTGATGSNVSQEAEAGLKGQQMRQIDAVQANPALAGAVGTSQAAGQGKALFNPTGNTGQSVQSFTGESGPVNAVLARLFQLGENAQINQRNAAAGASSASAANSYAAAGQHKAQTAKINQDIGMGSKGVLQQTDQGLMLVDPRTGTARAVTGADGAPVAGKSKDLTEGQAKANLFGNRMRVAAGIVDELAGEKMNGVTRPGNIKQTAESVVGIIPFVGDKLAEAAGTATNWTQSAGQQQVDQAQRDFINAVLRRESGAAIAESEFANARKQYFPAVGDSQDVLNRKRNNRNLATTLMLSEVPQAHRYKANSGGAGGTWEDATKPGIWSIKRVD